MQDWVPPFTLAPTPEYGKVWVGNSRQPSLISTRIRALAVADWSTTASENTTVGPVNIAEGCPAANMNNMGREIMAQVKQFADALPGSYQARDQTLSALAALATSGDRLPYATGVDTFATTPFTAFARTLLDDGNAEAARNTLGALSVSQSNLGATGFIEFAFGASRFRVAWGSFTANGNGYTTESYASPFSAFSIPVVSGVGEAQPGAQDNNPGVTNVTPSNFTVYNANNPCTCFYIAVGV